MQFVDRRWEALLRKAGHGEKYILNTMCCLLNIRNTLRMILEYGTVAEFRAELKKILTTADMPKDAYFVLDSEMQLYSRYYLN